MQTSVLLLPLVPLLAAAGPLPPPAGAPDTLRLVHVLYRHGARSPVIDYPTDPNPDPWPIGLGQLTNEGKQNQLELGRFLRSRYDGFLPELYHMNYTRVEATDVDRCLMSAQANLAGLFPPRGEDVWDAEIAWQPIPVHTVPVDDDLKLKTYKVSCPVYLQERDRVFASDEMAAIDADNSALYAYLTEYSGLDVSSVDAAGDLYDTLWIDDGHNRTVPEWAHAVPPGCAAPAFPDLLRPLRDLQFALYGVTPLLRRLGGGPLLKDMLEHMQDSVDGRLEPPSRKLFAYSGHDNNVACLLTTLGLYNGLAPPLACAVLVELHEEPEVGPTVQLFYRNDTTAEPYPLQLPGCQLSCPWDTFVQLTADVVPGDVRAECGL
ncbi:Lysosomal acid phosphatase [Amphibalanus amphitrite]|uniref:acid phosphatase n=1 Tax=Amphibalanus amphitrite TaxID=1232801 RepID=A0A6A4WHT2_AMPAM|nr:lysosomal acid phosphatase-like [Amphibalanus amphitrite]KAF0305623.1 Lysosomal acid phosphatase [Amphibalanus amphitrite]